MSPAHPGGAHVVVRITRPRQGSCESIGRSTTGGHTIGEPLVSQARAYVQALMTATASSYAWHETTGRLRP